MSSDKPRHAITTNNTIFFSSKKIVLKTSEKIEFSKTRKFTESRIDRLPIEESLCIF